MYISEFYLRANVTKYIDTKMSLFSCFFAHLWTVETKKIVVILTCTFLRNISSWKSIYKNRDLTIPWCTKIIFSTTCVKFGKFQNQDQTLFCSFFLNQICPMDTKLGLLCLRPSLNGWNVTHIRGYSIIAVYNRFNIANVTLALYYLVWCHGIRWLHISLPLVQLTDWLMVIQ